MRSTRILPTLALLLALPGWGRVAGAGPYTMDRFALGGGQRSTAAGSYSLTGGAAPPLVQSSNSALYSIQSGFWALPGTGTTGVADGAPITTTRLLRSAPNPFSARTEVAFALASARHASLEVFDLRGARVRELLDRTMDAGLYRLAWDGRDRDGVVLPAGIYWLQFRSGEVQQRLRVVRLP
jgi:hypothetical protein